MSFEDTLRSLKIKNNLVVGGTITCPGFVPAPLSVGLTNLTVGVAPSHVVKFAGTFTTVGGDVTEVITVPGVLGTDIVQVSVRVLGAIDATILAAAPGVGNITVTFDVDPDNDHVLQYVVLRAAV